MKTQLKSQIGGAALAMAAASLIGCAATYDSATASAKSDSMTMEKSMSKSMSVDMVHCYGVNTCKGHNDCKTANNSCKGMGSCKGLGFVGMPAKACEGVGGEVNDQWTGKMTTVDLVHCYGVNVCKGHNDCKTANNACKGMGSCKGLGFVATGAKSCTDIGGEVKA